MCKIIINVILVNYVRRAFLDGAGFDAAPLA